MSLTHFKIFLQNCNFIEENKYVFRASQWTFHLKTAAYCTICMLGLKKKVM